MSEPLEVGGSHVFLSIAFETHGEIFPDHPKDIRFLETLHGSAGQRDDEEQNGGNHSHEIKEEGADGRPVKVSRLSLVLPLDSAVVMTNSKGF